MPLKIGMTSIQCITRWYALTDIIIQEQAQKDKQLVLL